MAGTPRNDDDEFLLLLLGLGGVGWLVANRQAAWAHVSTWLAKRAPEGAVEAGTIDPVRLVVLVAGVVLLVAAAVWTGVARRRRARETSQ